MSNEWFSIWLRKTEIKCFMKSKSIKFKGALKAHIHISLYESNTLQEQDAALLFLSVIPWGDIFAYCHHPAQPLAATMFFNWVAICPYLCAYNTDYSRGWWPGFKMAAALAQRRCYSLIAILHFSLCGALGLPCLWQMLSYVHELSHKPMICSSPSPP